jgi:hypothetical protein
MTSRVRIGLAAAVLIGAGVVLRFSSLEGAAGIAFACWRVGAVMGALWLAWPQLVDLPRWLLAVVTGILLVGAWKPKLLWIAIPLAILIWVLRPRNRPAGRSR